MEISWKSFRTLVFGEKNKNLDPILEFFYSMDPEVKVKWRLWSYVIACGFIFSVFSFYFFGLWHLQNRMNTAVEQSKNMGNISFTYSKLQNRFLKNEKRLSENSISKIEKNIQNVLISIGVQMTNELKPQLLELPLIHPLSGRFKKLTLDLKFSNISLRNIVKTTQQLTTVCESCRVISLDIRQQDDNKLYFSADMVLEGFVENVKKH